MSKRCKGEKKKSVTHCIRRVYCKSKYRCRHNDPDRLFSKKVQSKDDQSCTNKKVLINMQMRKKNLDNSNRRNGDVSGCKRKKDDKSSVGPLQHVFYSVVNTRICMDKGTVAAAVSYIFRNNKSDIFNKFADIVACTNFQVGRSLIALHNKLDTDDTKYHYIDIWDKSGQNIIVLKGYDHKHLQYLLREAKYSAIGTHTLIQTWDSCKQIIVLSIFGVVEDLQDMLAGLSTLQ